ncbi:MAG: hypothetical protein WCR72_17405 [Bacteroidota bacterium]
MERHITGTRNQPGRIQSNEFCTAYFAARYRSRKASASCLLNNFFSRKPAAYLPAHFPACRLPAAMLPYSGYPAATSHTFISPVPGQPGVCMVPSGAGKDCRKSAADYPGVTRFAAMLQHPIRAGDT